MYFVFVTFLIKNIHCAISPEDSSPVSSGDSTPVSSGDSSPNPENIKTTVTNKSAINNETENKYPGIFEDWIAQLHHIRGDIDFKEVYEYILASDKEKQRKITEIIENEQNESKKSKASQLLANITSDIAVFTNKINYHKDLIKEQENSNYILFLKIVQYLEMNKAKYNTFATYERELVYRIQGLFLFLVDDIIRDTQLLLFLEFGLKSYNDIKNTFNRSYFNDEDVVSLQKIQTGLKKIITDKDNCGEALNDIEQGFNEIFSHKISLNVLLPELLDEKTYVNDIITSENRNPVVFEKEFIKRYGKNKSTGSIVLARFQFTNREEEIDDVIISIPILSTEYNNIPFCE